MKTGVLIEQKAHIYCEVVVLLDRVAIPVQALPGPHIHKSRDFTISLSNNGKLDKHGVTDEQ